MSFSVKLYELRQKLNRGETVTEADLETARAIANGGTTEALVVHAKIKRRLQEQKAAEAMAEETEGVDLAEMVERKRAEYQAQRDKIKAANGRASRDEFVRLGKLSAELSALEYRKAQEDRRQAMEARADELREQIADAAERARNTGDPHDLARVVAFKRQLEALE
jgi:hypothetical protein